MLFIVMDYQYYSLHQIVQLNRRGINLYYIRKISWQLMIFLKRLENLGIIHTDLKPGNIMVEEDKSLHIKVIDFNSSMFMEGPHYKLVQSLYYRAPEVTLGLNYDYMIDMWSVGCIIFELHHGSPLFVCKDSAQLISKICNLFGNMPEEMIAAGTQSGLYYTLKNNAYVLKQNEYIVSF